MPWLLNTLIEPSAPTFTIAMLATVRPAAKFRLDACGRDSLVGHAVRYVLRVAPVAVRFTATAPTPSAGKPLRPAIGTTTVPPATVAPFGPAPSTVGFPGRVSANRAGVTAW